MEFCFVFPKGEIFTTWKQNLFSIFSFRNCTISILNSLSLWFKVKNTQTDCCVKLTGMSVNLAVRDIGCCKISNGNSFLFWRLKIMYLEGSYLHWPFGGFPRSLSRESCELHSRCAQEVFPGPPAACGVLSCEGPWCRARDRQENGAVSLPRGFSKGERESKAKPSLFQKCVVSHKVQGCFVSSFSSETIFPLEGTRSSCPPHQRGAPCSWTSAAFKDISCWKSDVKYRAAQQGEENSYLWEKSLVAAV